MKVKIVNRYFGDQNEHDKVIYYAFSHLDNDAHDIYTNPGSHKNTSVNDIYPDIIITEKDNDVVKFIIEVETASSINHNEIKQWKEYLALGGIFYLLVPKSSRRKAELLCLQNNLRVRFGIYTKNSSGNITSVSYE